MKTLYLVAGARPNFMKIAPLVRALRANGANLGFKIIHTGQHYDHELNDVFFDELGIPAPDVLLGAGSGSHAQQTAKISGGRTASSLSGTSIRRWPARSSPRSSAYPLPMSKPDCAAAT